MSYKVVVQLTSSEGIVVRSLWSQIKNLLHALNDDVQIEVLCHSATIPFVTNAQNRYAEILDFLLSKQVKIAACENMLSSHSKNKKDLYRGVITVPSAIAELVVRQQQGWSYVKIS
ncbi:MAG: hypothetical protein JST87_11420 [Bacteroidetes bacterium]|nr:hypothetical protein [Bacteroidota bacterium]